MKIAPYYQNLLAKGLQVARSLEPITFIGMFDSGVDYLFTQSVPLLSSELKSEVKPIFLDLSGLTTKEAVIAEISLVLVDEFNTAPVQDYGALSKAIQKLAEKTKIVFVLYIGQEGTPDQALFLFLNRVRNLLGWKFSYCLFATTRFLHATSSSPIIEKVLRRNVVPVLPLASVDSQVVLANYEERYQTTVSEEKRKRIIDLSGGNPGLIKALYLQVIADPFWKNPNILEEQLYFRVKGIAQDLSPAMIDSVVGGKTKISPEEEYFFTRYGYGEIKNSNLTLFTPMLSDFLKHYAQKTPQASKSSAKQVDETLLYFTKSQRSVLEYLREHKGVLITKDTIAQVLWGEGWENKYSDWAIDQLLSTLREKMTSLKYKEKIITKKGEGIIFTS